METAELNPWLLALGLALIAEGLMPMLTPPTWRETIRKLASLPDGQLRFGGMALVSVGLLLIWSS